MHYTTNALTRAEFIAGLRALAAYLDSHPLVPVPFFGIQINMSADPADEGGTYQVDHVAQLLLAQVNDDTPNGGHYRAIRAFGPIRYGIVSILSICMDRYEAVWSYQGCVSPEDKTSRKDVA